MSDKSGLLGSSAIVKAKSRSQQVIEFKKPLIVAPRKSKPKILTEEKYIEELSNIIQRDFFPDLDKLLAQNEYLDAETQKDYGLMAEIRARYTDRTTETKAKNNAAMSPATFETPVNTCNSTPRPGAEETPASTSSKSSRINKVRGGSTSSISERLSLDSFLQCYTSEDNQSFQEIVEAAEEKLRQKFAVFYNHETLSANQLEQALVLPSIEQQFDKPDQMRKIETWKYTNMNSIMYVPDGVEMTADERLKSVERRRIIKHSATRLNQELLFDAEKRSTKTEDSTQDAEPKIKNYELLPSPSPRPGDAFSPIMTWGEIEGTPFRIDGSDTPIRAQCGPSFKINMSSRRETIAIALADKVGIKMRAQKQQALNAARKNIGSPFIRSNIERLAHMSPAAQRLATVKLGLCGTTPSPLHCHIKDQKRSLLSVRTHSSGASGKNRSRTITPVRIQTPKAVNMTKTIDTGSTLTDDLLEIPIKRRKAADFF